MERRSGQLKNFKSNFGKDRSITNASSIVKKTNRMKNNIGIGKSLAALSLEDETPVGGSKFTPNVPPLAAQTIKPSKQKRGFFNAPNQCTKKINVDDFTNNNYDAIEAVIKDILTSRKNKSAKKSKAKTDVRPKKHDGTEIDLEANWINYQEGNNKKAKDTKPKSAQARSYKHYYKQGSSENKNHADFVPKNLSDLNRIYEETAKSINDLNSKKMASRRNAAADKLINNEKQ